MNLEDHPTVKRLAVAAMATLTPHPDAAELRQLALECGAHDVRLHLGMPSRDQRRRRRRRLGRMGRWTHFCGL
jgi:hypothetical protein